MQVQYFSPLWDNFFSGCRLVLSCLAWSCLVLLCLCVWQSSIYYDFSIDMNINSPLYKFILTRKDTVQLQPLLLTAISIYGSGIFGLPKTKQGNPGQSKALCCVSQTRQEGCIPFENYCTRYSILSLYIVVKCLKITR